MLLLKCCMPYVPVAESGPPWLFSRARNAQPLPYLPISAQWSLLQLSAWWCDHTAHGCSFGSVCGARCAVWLWGVILVPHTYMAMWTTLANSVLCLAFCVVLGIAFIARLCPQPVWAANQGLHPGPRLLHSYPGCSRADTVLEPCPSKWPTGTVPAWPRAVAVQSSVFRSSIVII